jgi:hypothetical protein
MPHGLDPERLRVQTSMAKADDLLPDAFRRPAAHGPGSIQVTGVSKNPTFVGLPSRITCTTVEW